MNVFVSYSRIDKELVAPIAEVLRVSTNIFRDEDDIEPGKKWAVEIEQALNDSQIILVFWSRAASESKYVEAEYIKAIQSNKDIVPILLDDTRLIAPLDQYQWLVFRPFLTAAAKRGITILAAKSRGVGLIPGAEVLLAGRFISNLYLKFLGGARPLAFAGDEESNMRKLLDSRLKQCRAGSET